MNGRHLKAYELMMKDRDLGKDIWSSRAVESEATMLIPGSYNFLLLRFTMWYCAFALSLFCVVNVLLGVLGVLYCLECAHVMYTQH